MSRWSQRAQHAGSPRSGRGNAHPMKMSIGRRLSLLVLSQLLLAALGIITSIVALRRLAAEAAYLRHYIFPPLVVISTGVESSNALYALLARPSSDVSEDARKPIMGLRSFIDQYQQDWLTATSTLPEAVHLRAALKRAGELKLLDEERAAVNIIGGVTSRAALASASTSSRGSPGSTARASGSSGGPVNSWCFRWNSDASWQREHAAKPRAGNRR